MPGSVARLPNGGSDDGVPPADVYKAAVEEYRFQAEFNWSRTQYMLVFNTAILAAASAIASRPGHSAALVFVLGTVACVLSYFVMRTQHDYYRAARDHLRRVEESLGIPVDQRMDTTSTMRGQQKRRKASVTQLVYLLLLAVALADITGACIIAVR
ncbi:MAG TPA: hypothetical protein VF612_08815 [Jatrophihabitans sp.]|jgi:hypothetical protein|uniref:RipA family octameric membrane protein n=1 Tax=Jatrophihabitans sp. TaxID=1932789 RepID=UPI002EDE41EE